MRRERNKTKERTKKRKNKKDLRRKTEAGIMFLDYDSRAYVMKIKNMKKVR